MAVAASDVAEMAMLHSATLFKTEMLQTATG